MRFVQYKIKAVLEKRKHITQDSQGHQCCHYQQIMLYLTTQHTLFSSDERRLTKAEILHNKLSISISGPCVRKYKLQAVNCYKVLSNGRM